MKYIEVEEKPQKIKDLYFHFQKNEILLYLFLHNSILIPCDTLRNKRGLANVSFRSDRFVIEYDRDMFEKMSREQIYYVLLHEAFHVFKLHLQFLQRFRGREIFSILNTSMDCSINEGIEEIIEKNKKYDNTLLVPKKPTLTPPCLLPEPFKKKYKRHEWTTEIIYDWILEETKKQSKLMKKMFLKVGTFCKIRKLEDPNDNKYGVITKENSNETYELETRTEEEVLEALLDLPKKAEPEERFTGTYTEDELIPVVLSSDFKCSSTIPSLDPDFEIVHSELGSFEKSSSGNFEKINEQQSVTLNRILEEARQIKRMNKKSFSQEGSGHAFFNNIDDLYSKNLVNWKAKIRRKIDYFIVKETSSKNEYKKSYITYLRNPRSRYGIISKHLIEEKSKFAPNVILSIDTSGSIFSSENDLKLFFSEIENISKWLKTLDGRVFTFQWDTNITNRLEVYSPGDWKKIKHGKKEIRGGGGTTPRIAFEYLESIFKRNKNYYYVDEQGIRFGERWGKFPLLINLTDGCFGQMTEDDLKLYKEAPDKVFYLTENAESIYPKRNFILYNRNQIGS